MLTYTVIPSVSDQEDFENHNVTLEPSPRIEWKLDCIREGLKGESYKETMVSRSNRATTP